MCRRSIRLAAAQSCLWLVLIKERVNWIKKELGLMDRDSKRWNVIKLILIVLSLNETKNKFSVCNSLEGWTLIVSQWRSIYLLKFK